MALKEVAGTLEAEGMEAEIVPIGAKAVQGCIACRRGGASVALDRLNKYFSINNMPVVSSQYWNIAYGSQPGEAARDAEGMQTMRTLGRNMATDLSKSDTGVCCFWEYLCQSLHKKIQDLWKNNSTSLRSGTKYSPRATR